MTGDSPTTTRTLCKSLDTGLEFVLVVGRFKGFKAFWCENHIGLAITPHRFYQHERVAQIIESALP